MLIVTGPDRAELAGLADQPEPRAASRRAESAETLLLDATGRIEHAVRVVDDGVTTWLLVEGAGTAPLAAFLDRMRFMLRVEVADRSAEFATIGDAWASSMPRRRGGARRRAAGLARPVAAVVARRPPVRRASRASGGRVDWIELIVPRAALADAAAACAVRAGRRDARRSRRCASPPGGRALATEVDEKTIPHELDWLRSAVHLGKGCYRGQETVAKVHNLGHPPRRLVMLHLDGSDAVLPAPGDEVVGEKVAEPEPGEDPSGARSAASPRARCTTSSGPIALAVVKRPAPADLPLTVLSHGIEVAAAQVEIVPADAGAAATCRVCRASALRRP